MYKHLYLDEFILYYQWIFSLHLFILCVHHAFWTDTEARVVETL